MEGETIAEMAALAGITSLASCCCLPLLCPVPASSSQNLLSPSSVLLKLHPYFKQTSHIQPPEKIKVITSQELNFPAFNPQTYLHPHPPLRTSSTILSLPPPFKANGLLCSGCLSSHLLQSCVVLFISFVTCLLDPPLTSINLSRSLSP